MLNIDCETPNVEGKIDRQGAEIAKGRKGREIFGGRIFGEDDASAGMGLLSEKFQPQMDVNARG